MVYLNQLRIEDAEFEFLTAIELKQSDQLAAVNLVTLLIYQDDWNRAAELVSRLGLNPAQVTQAQARAEKLKSPGKSGPTVAACSVGSTLMKPTTLSLPRPTGLAPRRSRHRRRPRLAATTGNRRLAATAKPQHRRLHQAANCQRSRARTGDCALAEKLPARDPGVL